MRTKGIIRVVVILAILISNVSCDQISKNIVRQTIEYNEQIGFVHDYLTLTKVENTGAFLSLGNELPNALRIILLIALPVFVMTYGLFFLFTKTNISKSMLVGISFVLGGGIGNMYDRIVHGSVTDFMHIDFVIFQTGIFNMADVSIMTGMFLILIQSFFKKEMSGKLRT
jgi:signal peptidase II